MADSLIAALSAGRADPGKCPVGHFLKSLPDDEFNAVIEAMRRCRSTEPEDKGFNFAWLSQTLAANDKPLIRDVKFRRHMRGECSCDDSTR